MRITRLQVNHITNPLGFDLGKRPTFSWVVEDAKGTCATASRVMVTCADEVVVDTGWAALDAKACALDIPLAPRTRYGWKVSVRTDAGEEAESDAAWFETAKLDEPWQAQWVTCDYAEPRHPIFCKALGPEAYENVQSARLYICGLGVYEATLNGCALSDSKPEYLAPGTHAYDRWLQYQTYDVTELMQLPYDEGDDGLCVHLGHGWYSGRFGFILTDVGCYGDDWRLIAELRVSYADGSERVFGTDETWQVRRSSVVFSNIYDGERVDATLPALPPVPATLLAADEAEASTARLHERLSLPVVAHERFVPEVIHTPAGDTVLDLGQNICGTFELLLRHPQPADVHVHLQFGELLQDGEFYRENLRTAQAAYDYVGTMPSGGMLLLRPHFTFYGYRYVKVEGTFDLAHAEFVGIALYSDFDSNRGRITTGNTKVNQLISNARWGMRDNFLDTPTDCPQRDERMGWTGDANVFSGTALRLAAPYAFYRKYLYDMALEQAARGGQVPATVPSCGSRFGNGTAVWGDATCRIAWNMYEVDGDPAILAEHFDAMRGWVDWIEQTDGTEHLWGKVFQFGDWLALDGPVPGGVMGGTDVGLVAYLSWWDSTMTVMAAAHVLGRTSDEAHYRALADRIRSWIEAEYYTATGRCAVNTQTAYVLSLWYGFGSRAWNAAQLRRLLQENGGKLKTGFVGTPLLCPVLSQNGLDREAYDLLLNEEYPGWLFAVNLGATTVWERWDSLDAAGHITGIDMNSMNHYSYGSIVEWLMSYAAGLNLAAPGFARATVAPHVSWRLRSCAYELDTAAGTYRVAWECVDEALLRVAITVPFGAQAEVTLPFATEEAYAALGGHTLGAGTYEVTYHTTEPLRRVPSVDWTVTQILDDPAIAGACRPFVDGFDFCMSTSDPTKTLRQLQAEGLGQNVKMTAEQLAACDAALRELAD